MVGFETAFRRYRAVEKSTEYRARHGSDAFVLANTHTELHRLLLRIPARILGKSEKHRPTPVKRQAHVPILFRKKLPLPARAVQPSVAAPDQAGDRRVAIGTTGSSILTLLSLPHLAFVLFLAGAVTPGADDRDA